jgi:hypothetical protein
MRGGALEAGNLGSPGPGKYDIVEVMKKERRSRNN